MPRFLSTVEDLTLTLLHRTRNPALGSRVLGKEGGVIRIPLKHGGRPGSLRSSQWTKQEHRNEQKQQRGVKANTVGQKCLDGHKEGAGGPVLLSEENPRKSY